MLQLCLTHSSGACPAGAGRASSVPGKAPLQHLPGPVCESTGNPHATRALRMGELRIWPKESL